mmetsp:Transcript_119391/g.380765  ORF Transcript_119391/g.380765 Transcript_119391/m.380765 type:complete len:358 (-) Transcript_119391:1583-2656(-)
MGRGAASRRGVGAARNRRDCEAAPAAAEVASPEQHGHEQQIQNQGFETDAKFRPRGVFCRKRGRVQGRRRRPQQASRDRVDAGHQGRQVAGGREDLGGSAGDRQRGGPVRADPGLLRQRRGARGGAADAAGLRRPGRLREQVRLHTLDEGVPAQPRRGCGGAVQTRRRLEGGGQVSGDGSAGGGHGRGDGDRGLDLAKAPGRSLGRAQGLRRRDFLAGRRSEEPSGGGAHAARGQSVARLHGRERPAAPGLRPGGQRPGPRAHAHRPQRRRQRRGRGGAIGVAGPGREHREVQVQEGVQGGLPGRPGLRARGQSRPRRPKRVRRYAPALCRQERRTDDMRDVGGVQRGRLYAGRSGP